MKAIILAAGKGTRMGELTSDLPKPMLRVQGKPILEHILAGILSAGVREFCIVTGHRADVVESYFGDGSRWGARIQYVRQLVQDGTGKAPEMAKGFANRMISIFTRNAEGKRPVHNNYDKFQQDPHWRDLILFYEYFHGDTGMGLGASHQTGWTGLVASLIDEWRR